MVYFRALVSRVNTFKIFILHEWSECVVSIEKWFTYISFEIVYSNICKCFKYR